MGEMDHLKHQAQGMSPQKRLRGEQKLYERTAALAHLVSLVGWILKLWLTFTAGQACWI